MDACNDMTVIPPTNLTIALYGDPLSFLYFSLNTKRSLLCLTGPCEDIDIISTPLSARAIYVIRAQQKWLHLYA